VAEEICVTSVKQLEDARSPCAEVGCRGWAVALSLTAAHLSYPPGQG